MDIVTTYRIPIGVRCHQISYSYWFNLLARQNLFIGYFSIFKVFFFCQDKRATWIKLVIFHLKALISGVFFAKGRGHGHHDNDSPSIFRILKNDTFACSTHLVSEIGLQCFKCSQSWKSSISSNLPFIIQFFKEFQLWTEIILKLFAI